MDDKTLFIDCYHQPIAIDCSFFLQYVLYVVDNTKIRVSSSACCFALIKLFSSLLQAGSRFNASNFCLVVAGLKI